MQFCLFFPLCCTENIPNRDNRTIVLCTITTPLMFSVKLSNNLAVPWAKGTLKQSHVLNRKWCSAVLHRAKDCLMTTTAREYCWQVAFVSLWEWLWWRWQRKKGWWLGLCPEYLWPTLTHIITSLTGITLVCSRWMFWDSMVHTYMSGDGVVTLLCVAIVSVLYLWKSSGKLLTTDPNPALYASLQVGPWPNPTLIRLWIRSVLMWPTDLSVCFSKLCHGFRGEG